MQDQQRVIIKSGQEQRERLSRAVYHTLPQQKQGETNGLKKTKSFAISKDSQGQEKASGKPSRRSCSAQHIINATHSA